MAPRWVGSLRAEGRACTPQRSGVASMDLSKKKKCGSASLKDPKWESRQQFAEPLSRSLPVLRTAVGRCASPR